jgi:hypothetical protein
MDIISHIVNSKSPIPVALLISPLLPCRLLRSSCDAADLELAIRQGRPLATKDDALAAAAKRSGVAVLP